MADFWNYRVVRIKDGDDFLFQIHEAHYHADQRDVKYPVPHSITVNPSPVLSGSGSGIVTVLKMMRAACKMPILDYDSREPINDRPAHEDLG